MEETGESVGRDDAVVKSFAESVQDAIVRCAGPWLDVLDKVPVQHAAILPSEMLAFCCVCEAQGVELVIESGRRFGYSTEVLAYGPWDVVSIENNPNHEQDARFKSMPQVTLVTGSGEHKLDSLIDGRRTAVLLDGPKGMVALSLFLSVQSQLRVGALHDIHHGSPIRQHLEQHTMESWLTDDAEFLEEYGHIDAGMMQYRQIASHSDLFATGNVLGIFPGSHYGTH